jgi:CRP-like cAMP-binding protein
VTSSFNPLQLLVSKLRGHAHLEQSDCAALLALPVSHRTIEPQGHIVRDGDAPSFTGMLLSGFAYRHKLGGDGKRQIVSLQVPGDPFDFQNLYLDESDHTVQALTRADVALIPRDAIQRLAAERPAIARAISVLLMIEASISREWILNVGQRPASARIAHVLCELAVRLEAQGLTDDHGYELPMTQEQLADVVGLTPVHVNRTLKVLEGQGLLKREKRRVTFPDWQGLRDVADFNQRYLHMGVQQATAG